MRRLGCAVFVLSMALPAFAADSPWNGTWKVNEAKSKFTGRTFTISEKGGMMHYSGDLVEYDFACDGKEYTTEAEHTLACTKTGDGSYQMVSKVKGKEIFRSKRTISKDGKTMTADRKGQGVDGTAYEDKLTFARVAGTQGMVGTWKSVKDDWTGPEIMKIMLSGGTFRQEYTASGEVFEGKLDGSSSPVKGPRVTPGSTSEMKADGPRAIQYVEKLNGKETIVGREVLSADSKVITDTSWVPGKENEKIVVILEKQ